MNTLLLEMDLDKSPDIIVAKVCATLGDLAAPLNDSLRTRVTSQVVLHAAMMIHRDIDGQVSFIHEVLRPKFFFLALLLR